MRGGEEGEGRGRERKRGEESTFGVPSSLLLASGTIASISLRKLSLSSSNT